MLYSYYIFTGSWGQPGDVSYVKLPYLQTLLIIVIWWVASSVTSITSKEVLNQGNNLDGQITTAFVDLRWIDLTAIQLLVGTVISVIYLRIKYNTSIIPDSSCWRTLIIAVMGHLVGNLATNASFAAVSSSMTLIIKACEPLFTIICVFCYTRQPPNVMTVLSVLSICQGACMFVAADVSFNMSGMWAAVISNMAFPIRNIAVKSNLNLTGPLHYYALLSICGLILLLPVSLIKLVVTQELPLLEPIESLVTGLSHGSYNIASLGVLRKVTPLTHAILNLSKRIFAIILNMLYFSTSCSSLTYIGLLVFAIGNICFYQ